MSLELELNELATLKGVSIDAEAVIASGQSAKSIFCNGWSTAKVVLEATAAMIKNPIAKLIIGIVIKAGNALSAKICS
jgi:hypothetical protein